MLTILNFVCSFWKNSRTCVLKVEAICETSRFSKNKQISVPTQCFEPGTSVSPLCHLCVGSRSPTSLCYRDSMLKGTPLKCLCLSTSIIFNPWWIFSPCNMFMCTNKMCFAGVGTWPKPIFRIRIICLSYPCESKKNQNFLSVDQTSIPGVNQVFAVLEWNLNLVLLSKILDRFKRLFVVQIPRVTVYREMRNIYV